MAMAYSAGREERHAAIAMELLDAGANPDAVDANGQTPLHWAAGKTFVDGIRILLDAGASAKVEDNFQLKPWSFVSREASDAQTDPEARRILWRLHDEQY